jgi:hypothetical protein
MKGFAGMSTAPYLTAADSKKGALTKAPAAAPNRKHGSQGQSITIPSATQQSDDARNAAMSTDGGREPEPRTLGNGTHGGLNMYNPEEKAALTAGKK